MAANLAIDLLEQRLLERARRRQDLVVGPPGLVAGGQVVEQLGQVGADRVVAGEQAEVAVDPRRPGVVVAGADVGVAAQAGEVPAHHQDHLRVRLQADHAVHDVDAGLLQPARPLDVGGLVEAGLDLDHHRHLLAVARRLDQVVDDPGARRGPVQGHLDREHLGVAAGLAHEALDRRAEQLVGVLQQDRPGLADDVEDAALVLELGVGDRIVGRIVQRGVAQRGDLHQIAHPEQPALLEHVLGLVQAELGGEHAAMQRLHALLHLEPDDRGELAVAQLRFDHRDQIVRLLLVLLGIGVAGDPEQLAGLEIHVGKQDVQVVRHHLLERHEHRIAVGPQEPGHAEADRHLDPGERRLEVLAVVERHQQIEREVGQERERVRRVHRQRRDQREDVAQIVLAQPRLLRAAEIASTTPG